MKHLIVLIIAMLIPTAASAGECAGDKNKFCGGAADVNACLEQHKAELSAACQAKREARKKEQAPAEKH